MYRFLISVLFVVTCSSAAFAQEFALTGGFRYNYADTNVALATTEGKAGVQFGALAIFPMISPFAFRTGFLYTQRNGEILYTNGQSTDVKFSYLDIPLTVMAKFGDYAGVFAGPIIAINQSSECADTDGTACNATDVKSAIIPIAIGMNFKFAPQMGGEIFAEFYSGNLAKGYSDMRSLGANFVFYFE